MVRPNLSQVVRIEIPCISVSECAFAQERFQTAKCKGALRHTNTREFYSKNLRAVGPSHAQLFTFVEDETAQKQDNKTRHRDQSKVNK